jgi:1,4-alpha-glucan branching enzyme
MGDEFRADTPFQFFCDFGEDLAAAVTEGRRNEFSRFARFRDPGLRAEIPDPNARETFLACRLDWNSLRQGKHKACSDFYRQLLRIRSEQIVPRLRGMGSNCSRLRMLSERTLVAAWILPDRAQLTLWANLADQSCQHSSETPGELLYLVPAGMADQLGKRMPPWSAAWFLTE